MLVLLCAWCSATADVYVWSHKAQEMLLTPCHKSVEVTSQSALLVWPVLSVDGHRYLCCPPHTQVAHLGFPMFLNPFYLRCFSTTKKNNFQSCPQRHTSGNAIVLLYFRHCTVCVMCRLARPGIHLKQVKYCKNSVKEVLFYIVRPGVACRYITLLSYSVSAFSKVIVDFVNKAGEYWRLSRNLLLLVYLIFLNNFFINIWCHIVAHFFCFY